MNAEQVPITCSVPGCHEAPDAGGTTSECTKHRNAHHGRAYKYNKVGAQAQKLSKEDFPSIYQVYIELRKGGTLSDETWKRAGGTQEQANDFRKRASSEFEGALTPQEVNSVTKRLLFVPEDFKQEYNLRPKADKLTPSEIEREDSPIRNASQSKHWQDMEPTSIDKAYVLTRVQHGVDAFGVAEGTFFQRGSTYKKTKFHAAHIKSIAEFNDGREHWWNDDGSANWTTRAEFINQLESSFPNAADRDCATKARLEESRIKYNVLETTVRGIASDPRTVILELKVKAAAD